MNAIPSLEDVYVIVQGQLKGLDPKQEDHVTVFEHEYISIADGVSAMPHGEVASVVASETALWGYKHIRQRPYYWENKIKLLQRIFRTTNISLWQKRKEHSFSEGLASTLCIAILGYSKIWIGSVGDSRVYLIREGLIEELIPPELQQNITVPMALGVVRNGIVPRYSVETLIRGDMLLVCTDGIADVLTEEDIRVATERSSSSKEQCQKIIDHLLAYALERGSNKNMSVCLIKKYR